MREDFGLKTSDGWRSDWEDLGLKTSDGRQEIV